MIATRREQHSAPRKRRLGPEEEHPLLEKTEEEWDLVLSVDLNGPFLCSQAAAREMARRATGGTIINISGD